MPDVMKIKEAEGFILKLLREAGKPLATRAIEDKAQGKGKQCPDSAVKFLAKMRYKGLIKGELSREHGGWVWWVDEVH